jgi:phosphopantetheine adenylyltransferase
MAEFNESHYPEAKTVLLKAEESLSELSSTSVRELIKQGTPLDEFLPEAAIKTIREL